MDPIFKGEKMRTQSSEEIAQDALSRARNGESVTNYPAIFQGFAEKGIPESEIHPRENVFTFHAWKAKGRIVKRGEHGVKIVTWINVDDPADPDGDGRRIPRSATVFHVSQTIEL